MTVTKRRAALFAALPLAAAGYLWLGRAGTPAAAETGPATAVRGADSTLVAPGRVEPLHDPVALAFEVTGRITTLAVDEGDRVHAGDVVARLDDRLPAARVASAKATLAAAQARYTLARRGPRAEDIAAARADADAAAAEADHRGVEQARSAHLGDVGALASSSVDADVAAAKVAHAQATAATARYRALAAGTRVEQIDEAAADVAAAKAELAAAEVALDQTVLRAPGDGVVLRRTAEVGALITLTPPVTVVTVADVAALEVRAEVDETSVGKVAVGATGYATADAYGDKRFPIRVTRLTGELGRKTVRDDDPRAKIDTRVLEVVARLTDDAALPLGLRMTIHID
jgi:multidrug resistance efflux pump